MLRIVNSYVVSRYSRREVNLRTAIGARTSVVPKMNGCVVADGSIDGRWKGHHGIEAEGDEASCPIPWHGPPLGLRSDECGGKVLELVVRNGGDSMRSEEVISVLADLKGDEGIGSESVGGRISYLDRESVEKDDALSLMLIEFILEGTDE